MNDSVCRYRLDPGNNLSRQPRTFYWHPIRVASLSLDRLRPAEGLAYVRRTTVGLRARMTVGLRTSASSYRGVLGSVSLVPAVTRETRAMTAEVWLITGAQASGKSTVADLLARQFERGVHVRGGQFYRWAIRGWVEFDDPGQQQEARRLLDLRYRLSARVAVEYASAGFTCVVQDNIYGGDVATWLEMVQPLTAHLVVLRPEVSTVARRDEARNLASGKVAYRGDFTPEVNDAHLATTPRHLGGLWLDSSEQTPTETVSEILARAEETLTALDVAAATRTADDLS